MAVTADRAAAYQSRDSRKRRALKAEYRHGLVRQKATMQEAEVQHKLIMLEPRSSLSASGRSLEAAAATDMSGAPLHAASSVAPATSGRSCSLWHQYRSGGVK